MRRLAELLGDLAAAPHQAARMRRLTAYFEDRSNDLGWAAAWLTGALKPPRQSPAKLRALAEVRVDAELFRLSAAAIGDVAETTALIWPGVGDLPVATVVGNTPLANLMDQLDAEARVMLVRLHAGRKPKGVKLPEVQLALAEAHSADPALIAGAMITEDAPYPRMTAWLQGKGPAPNWAPPAPPMLPKLTAPPETPFTAWRLPPGEAVSVEAGRAFGADGAERKFSAHTPDGWGYLHDQEVTNPSALAQLDDPASEQSDGATLLIRFNETGDWAIWPAARKTIICPVTFIEIGRAVAVTLGVAKDTDVAPLAKLTAPDAAKVSAFARKAMTDKFGPVRQVGPGLWAEVSYDAVRPAPRRKIGVVLDGAQIERLIWEDGPATPDLSDIL